MRTAIIIIIGLVLIFGIPAILLIDAKYKERHNFQCTKCFNIFDIYENQLNSYRINGKLHVKCPKCRKYSAVKMIRKE
jgi:hypothetical protein